MSSATSSTTTTAVVVFDLATLRFEWTGARQGVTVWTPARRLLSAWERPVDAQISEREAVFQALDRALARPVSIDGVEHQVALYNPYTTQVALSPVPGTVTFTDGDPLSLALEGSVATLSDDILTVGARELPRLDVNLSAVSAALAAHRA